MCVNLHGGLRLLETARRLGPTCRFVFASKAGWSVDQLNIVSRDTYRAPKMTVKNLMTGAPVEIDADTPWCCNPASETYWSM
jgi:hypothetical protein